MEREERKQHFSTERKLETISFLRRSAAENKQRLYQADAILNGQPADRLSLIHIYINNRRQIRLMDKYAEKRLLHTPEGVRDIYGRELLKKLTVQDKLMHTFASFGYKNIQTPVFEFFDVFGSEIGTTRSNELYKFFDKEGNTLVLRPDFTPSMARCAAKYVKKFKYRCLDIFIAEGCKGCLLYTSLLISCYAVI